MPLSAHKLNSLLQPPIALQLGVHGSPPSSATIPPRLHILTVSNKADHPCMLEMVRIAGRTGLHVQALTFQNPRGMLRRQVLISKLKARAEGGGGAALSTLGAGQLCCS